MHIILLIFIGLMLGCFVYLLIKGIRVFLTMRRYALDMKDILNGQPPRSASGATKRRDKNRRKDSARQQTEQPKPRAKKKIDPSVGEYIEFQEIACTVTSTDSEGNTTQYTQVEQQIVDIEWEDLPAAAEK